MKRSSYKNEVIRVESLLTILDEFPSFVFVMDEEQNIVYGNKAFYRVAVKFINSDIYVTVPQFKSLVMAGGKVFNDIINEEITPLIKQYFTSPVGNGQNEISISLNTADSFLNLNFRILNIELSPIERCCGFVVSGSIAGGNNLVLNNFLPTNYDSTSI